MFNNFKVDLLSFALGFVASTLTWWLFSRLRPLLPLLWSRMVQQVKKFRQRNLEGADEFLRKDTIRRAQKQHLASAMFALDEILVPPALLAPLPTADLDTSLPNESIASQVIPYMPDWPEMAASQGAASLTIGQALQKGSSIAILGQPGCGKTVALAAFACQLARKDPALGNQQSFLPIYFHILDLNVAAPSRDPISAVIKIIAQRVSVIYQNQLTRLVNDRFSDGQAILIIDGIDELPHDRFPEYFEFLKSFREKYPAVRILITTSPYYLDGIASLGITPLGLTAWGPVQRAEFLERWGTSWEKYITPEAAKTNKDTVPHTLINYWLKVERGFPTPFEWTLRVWGAYAGDLLPGISGPLETFVSRFVTGSVTRGALESMAREFLIRKVAALPYNDLDNLLTAQASQVVIPALILETGNQPEPQPGSPAHPTAKKSQKAKRDVILSVGEQILEELVKAGIIVEHTGSQIRFVNPALVGYLASPRLSSQDIPELIKEPFWPPIHQALRYIIARGDDNWIGNYLQSMESPLQQPLLAAARWLSYSSGNAPWRALVFKNLLSGIQNERLPLSLRARMISAFVTSNDPSALKLFKQLLASRMQTVRQLAVLATGAWGDPAMVAELIAMLQDEDQSIRNAACLALVALHTDSSLGAVAEALMTGDEMLRQTAAESLVFLPNQGAEIIQEATKVSDLLTRRAAVFGLLQIHEPWAKEALEKIAIEDGQWVVRNAAAQALDALQKPDPRIPQPLPAPHDSPWLVGFAGKRGTGLSAFQSPVDALLMALKSGTLEDQKAALVYLKEYPDERVVIEVYNVFYGEHPELKDYAFTTIWHWNLTGLKLTDPSILGIQ